MNNENIEGFLITKPENIRYISNFSAGADAKLLVTNDELYIITDSRYYEQVEKECSNDWELVKNTQPGFNFLTNLDLKINKIGFEAEAMSYADYTNLKKYYNSIEGYTNIIEQLRVKKEESELELLRFAASIGDKVFSEIKKYIKPGVKEKVIANRIELLLKEYGAEKHAFDTIVVSGKKASLPHGKPDDKLLEEKDMVTMDFGGFYKGYASDMTRTVIVKESYSKFYDLYKRLLEAQKIGLSSVRAGVVCSEVDDKVRTYLKKYDLDSYFAHSTGHGVGLEVHENPRLSSTSKMLLEENMVVTVEPGIYIPGWGGIRIEDTVIVKNGDCEVITQSDKKLLII
ncbi:Aminopeptidase YpdF (MP-, MA-, MS-, AP-, NP- specific) [Candidatus Syntrophocurvum alkaliphilum]|uniref:Aminopeptidase YpdF (MP-, MA-, MS-, AP-, NP-specific) n=1 Tax=Candidatus Syntrophocurvum alkaliphilum TaxID=2293317 RepID=A0A6I6D8W0_9FIRM|nr:aminopeptidase P family protein [Candidatus Syntrophocurvum alkaliphilum]QGT98947.1 Aminopeptidase YpdF (MP-, MA-, MS-, AP-, NP- specific) [Candidatus Syntrophocurvum alkaliphilum]